MKESNLISRRKFIGLISLSPILVILINKKYRSKNVYSDSDISQELIDKINSYNSKRNDLLRNTFEQEYKSDLENGRTIWIDKSLKTYSELFK